jgi:ADP-heptose:LPS heptosyltransferase
MRTLVIQLGRLGDVIQTTPLLRDLAATDGGAPADLLLVHPNQAAILGLPSVATIRTIGEDLKPLDDQIATGFRQRRIPTRTRTLLEQLNLPRYDRVINASHAALGCWLAGQIASSERHGGVITPEGECLYQGAAQTYRIAMLAFREQNWFNVVDLMRGAAPARQSATQGSPATSRLYVNESVALPFALPAGRKVALNVGASETGRTWPAAHFARIAERVAAQGFAPILVGAPSDCDACAAVRVASSIELPSFAGKTSIPEMARLLAQCELLVSADTGAAHIAAAVGTTVLGLYGATAYFAETAPWGAGHLILQTRIGASMSALPVDTVLAAALNRLGRLDAVRLQRELTQSGQAAWETTFLPANADPLGGLCYRPVHSRPFTIEELFTRALRHVFAREFCGGVGRVSLDYRPDFSSLAGADQEVHDARIVRLDFRLWQGAESLAQVLEQMQEGATACATMSTQHDSRSSIGLEVAKLTNALDGLKSLTENAEWTMFRPVVHYLDWRLRMMPVLPPKETFTSHALEYRLAARLVRDATGLLRGALEGNQDRSHPKMAATTTATMNRDWDRIAV